MRAGILDVGSNSANLLITDLTAGGPPVPVRTVKCPTRLAEAIGPDGAVEPAAVDRLTGAISQSVAAARRAGVDELIACATSAVRDAANAVEILAHVEAAGGVRLGFLDGRTEARLTFQAARAWFGWSAGPMLLADIGGGSMEIAYGDAADPRVALSLPLGAGRLTRRHLPDDPPRRKQVKRLRRHVRDRLDRALVELPADRPVVRAVATSRTFTQLAVLTGAPKVGAGPHVPRRLELAALRDRIDDLAAMDTAGRARLRGVSAPRARQLVAGAIVAEAVMTALNLERLDVCPWALREGIALRRAQALAGPGDMSDIAHLIQRPAAGPRLVPVPGRALTF